MRLVIGNRDAIVRHDAVLNADGSVQSAARVETLEPGNRWTDIIIPDGKSVMDAVTDITHRSGVWAAHAVEGAVPAWIATDSKALETLLGAVWEGVEVRVLDVAKMAKTDVENAVEDVVNSVDLAVNPEA